LDEFHSYCFNFKEKKELCEQLVNLSPHFLENIISIINESEPEIIEKGDSECSFDINELKVKTLMKLKEYIGSINSDLTKPVGGGSGLDKKESNNKKDKMKIDHDTNLSNNFIIKKENEIHIKEENEMVPITIEKFVIKEKVVIKEEKEETEETEDKSEKEDEEEESSNEHSDENYIENKEPSIEEEIMEEEIEVAKDDIMVNFVLYDLRPKVGEKKGKRRCPKCKKQFKDKSNLVKHIRTHTGEKPYSCQYCGKTFRHTSTRNDHLNIHLNRNPHVCDYEGCNKQFANAANLKRHKRIHTGEKPYQCRYCDKRFTQSTNCKQHERIHLKGK